MTFPIKAVLFLLTLGIACSLIMVGSLADRIAEPAGSVVKVTTEGGHGSATHIGGGAFLTAAHVVSKSQEVTILADDGTERKAEVVWVNTAYDVALLRAVDHASIRPAYLSCRVPERDEVVTAYGNPLMMENIKTFGYVSGKVGTQGPWRSVIPLNIAIAGGMSGGAIFDYAGNLVGVIVGVPLQQVGMGGSMVGIGFAVDGKSVCGLLARDA